MNIIHQNIGISLATKALFVGLTAFGMASLWGAIAADVGVSLLVVANALRLLRAKKDNGKPKDYETLSEKEMQGVQANGH